jgi:hypothetical protein
MRQLEAQLEISLSEPLLVAQIARAAKTSWRAAAWLLERRHVGWAKPLTESTAARAADPDDPVREVDQLAARRRAALKGRLQPE